MPELDTRFRNLSRVPAPDLWPDIERRTPRPEPVRSRATVIAVALVLAAVGVAVVASAFLGDVPRQTGPTQPAPTPPVPVEPVLDATLPIRWPVSIVHGEGSVWVAASENDRNGGGTVYRIDPDTAEIVAEIAVPTVPGWETGGGGMEAAGGSLWIAGSEGSHSVLVRIDAATNALADIVALGGDFAGDVTVDQRDIWATIFDRQGMQLVRVERQDLQHVFVMPLDSDYARQVLAVDGTIWVHEHEVAKSVVGDSVLTRVDPRSGEVIESVPIGSSLTSVTEDGQAIWATTWTSQRGNLLARLDPHTGEFEIIPAGSFDYLVKAGEGGLWGRGLDQPSDRLGLARFDPVTGRIDASVPLKPDQNPIALTVAPGSVWVATVDAGVLRFELRPG